MGGIEVAEFHLRNLSIFPYMKSFRASPNEPINFTGGEFSIFFSYLSKMNTRVINRFTTGISVFQSERDIYTTLLLQNAAIQSSLELKYLSFLGPVLLTSTRWGVKSNVFIFVVPAMYYGLRSYPVHCTRCLALYYISFWEGVAACAYCTAWQ